jgi:hypothetical protein
MSNQNTTMKMEDVANSPLQLFQLTNLATFLTFFSPIILATSITGMSFVFQNFKGLIYLAFLIGCCIIRNFVYMMAGASPVVDDRTICTSIQYSKYGNPTFSAFVFAFTIMYLSFPMFSNNSVNYWVFTSLIVYFLMDMLIRIYKNCIIRIGDLFLNVLLGASSAALIVTLMYAGGSGKHLFFNEMSSDKQMCYQPKKQTFKCSLYSNGELVSEL